MAKYTAGRGPVLVHKIYFQLSFVFIIVNIAAKIIHNIVELRLEEATN
mgnify:CR=1 FL=1